MADASADSAQVAREGRAALDYLLEGSAERAAALHRKMRRRAKAKFASTNHADFVDDEQVKAEEGEDDDNDGEASGELAPVSDAGRLKPGVVTVLYNVARAMEGEAALSAAVDEHAEAAAARATAERIYLAIAGTHKRYADALLRLALCASDRRHFALAHAYCDRVRDVSKEDESKMRCVEANICLLV